MGSHSSSTYSSCGVDGCKLLADKLCSKCLKQQYCGQAHQNEHWKEHKKVCSSPLPRSLCDTPASPPSRSKPCCACEPGSGCHPCTAICEKIVCKKHINEAKPNFETEWMLTIARIKMNQEDPMFAHAKLCSFCNKPYCFDCQCNSYCSTPGCAKLACSDCEYNMEFCEGCFKTSCRRHNHSC